MTKKHLNELEKLKFDIIDRFERAKFREFTDNQQLGLVICALKRQKIVNLKLEQMKTRAVEQEPLTEAQVK